MHTEKLENLRPSWIAFGWFIAAAVTALLILAFVAFGLMAPDSTRNEGVLTAMALLIGFLVGGFFVGVRTRAAPILHGVGIGLFSLVVWFLANLIPGEATGWTAWRVLPTIQALALVALQTVAAIVGARMAVRMGRP
jgi:putative membrane protein (TIGR04086 family)